MPKRDDDDKFEFIPVDDDIAEWRKEPGYMRLYKEATAELRLEVKAHKARTTRKFASQRP